MTIDIDKKLHNEIKEYCNLNNLKISEFVNDILKKALLNEKYGDAPFLKKVNITPEPVVVEPEVIQPAIIEPEIITPEVITPETIQEPLITEEPITEVVEEIIPVIKPVKKKRKLA